MHERYIFTYIQTSFQVVDGEVSKGVPLNKIVLGGFSMGGAQAIHTALGDKDLAEGMHKRAVCGICACVFVCVVVHVFVCV
jgi:hypothetical protein